MRLPVEQMILHVVAFAAVLECVIRVSEEVVTSRGAEGQKGGQETKLVLYEEGTSGEGYVHLAPVAIRRVARPKGLYYEPARPPRQR
jgi:hypothetical protein